LGKVPTKALNESFAIARDDQPESTEPKTFDQEKAKAFTHPPVGRGPKSLLI
jgi:hypothetical protein